VKRIAAIIAVATLSACASIMHGTSQDVGISSSPTTATVTLDNQHGGVTPFIAHLSLTRKTSGWVWGNIVFGGLIGLAVDAITGGLYNLTPEQLTSTLAAEKASIAPTKDGIYVILVRETNPSWIKVGQLTPVGPSLVGE